MVIHLDSSYLVDLLREQRRGEEGKATAFLEQHPGDDLVVPVFVLCELEAGAASGSAPERGQARLRTLFQAVRVAYPDERFAPAYAEVLTALKRAGRTVDTMDLLIATAALVDQAALVTANRRHFDGITGLTVLGY